MSGDFSVNGPDFLQRRLKLRQLRLILVLNETRSMSVAAERLCISQAAVSKARAEIEDLLGMPIFSRSGGRWELTALGGQMVAAASRIMAELDYLNDEFLMLRNGSRGTVVMGMRTVAMVPFVAKVCADFKRLHPGVTIKLMDAPLADLLAQLDKGSVDLIVAPFGDHDQPPQTEGVLLAREDHVVMASPGHPLGQGAMPEWVDAVRAAWCMPAQTTRTRMHLTAFLIEQRLPFPANLIEVNSFLMMTTLMQEMPLLNLAPVGFARGLSEQKLAQILPLSVGGAFDTLSLIWHKCLPMPTATRMFRDFMLRMSGDFHGTAPLFKVSSLETS